MGRKRRIKKGRFKVLKSLLLLQTMRKLMESVSSVFSSPTIRGRFSLKFFVVILKFYGGERIEDFAYVQKTSLGKKIECKCVSKKLS